jgi:hypothetical protein
MTGKMMKQSDAGSSGCGTGCLTFFLISMLFSYIGTDMKSGGVITFGFFAAIGGGILAFVLVKQEKEKNYSLQKKKEDQKVQDLVATVEGKKDTVKETDKSIVLMCSATYLGGHKKYGKQADVTVVLTKERILLKEMAGHPLTRIDIPYEAITDFGIATKEQITLGRMLLVGILAFALKAQTTYFFIKYKDKLGFENNPVLGGFVGKSISEVSSKLYSTLEGYRSYLISKLCWILEEHRSRLK